MTQNSKGIVIFVAAIGAMLSLISGDVATLTNWQEATQPAFVAKALAHLGAVIAAFVGGRLVNANGVK